MRSQLEAPFNRSRNRQVDIFRHAIDPGWAIHGHPMFREWRPAGEHLVEDEAERVEVASRGDFSSFELLRRHVRGRAVAQLCVRELARARRQPEIGDEHLAVAVEHDVPGLQIAMYDTLVMGRRQAGAQPPRDLNGLVVRQPSNAAQQRRQVLAVDVLHRNERCAAHFVDVVHAAHIRV